MDTISVNILNQLAATEENMSLIEKLYNKAAFSWSEFLFVGATLFAAYFILSVAQRFLSISQLFGRFQRPIKQVVTYFLLVFEPLVILLLSSAFLMINPIYHGLLLGLIMLFAYAHMKNYVNGRVMQFNASFTVGREIRTEKLEGIIDRKGRLGLQIKTAKGVHFVSYSQLIKDSYMLLSGDDISGFYELEIIPNQPNEKYNYESKLIDSLSTVPYLDWNHRPEITIDDDYKIKARIVVKDENHLHDLVKLIQDWNYSCKILK
jgi:hypothetical protein